MTITEQKSRIEILEGLINHRNKINDNKNLNYTNFAELSTAELFKILLDIKSVTDVKSYALEMFKIFLDGDIEIIDLVKSNRESEDK